ncbi:MAG: peptide ABC transporter substrate-binding protein [Campylobacterales bacterium]|nr:peptide ABC transporter substrate-binding protein [Campylobacterales bacterium]
MKTFLLFLAITTSLLATTLHLSIPANPSRFNPILATDSASSSITRWLFNGLVRYDKDGNIEPELAQSYAFLSPTLLEFRLRNDVFWSDGAPFSAKDVLFTYEAILSPEIFTPYSSGFSHVESVEIVDEYTLHVRYKYPYFKALEIWMMEVLPHHLLKDEKALMTSRFNQTPVGTGPYILETFALSKNIVLRANPHYFEGKPKPERLVFHFLPDNATEFMMLRSQKLDLSSITPLQHERQLDAGFHDFYAVHESIAHSYAYVGLNLEDPKFQDPRVRQALSLAIDRQELVDILLFGHGEVCTGPFLPRTNAFNPEVKAPQQESEKAKALLAQAGYTAENPLEFTLIASSGSRAATAEVLQYQLAKAGILMRIRVMEWQAFLNTVILPRRFEAVLLAWNLGLKSDAYSIWHSESRRKGGFNFVGYANGHVDALIKEAERTVDGEKFGKIYREIYRHIAEDVPYLFLYIPKSLSVVNRAITPVEPAFIGITHNLEKWEKLEE